MEKINGLIKRQRKQGTLLPMGSPTLFCTKKKNIYQMWSNLGKIKLKLFISTIENIGELAKIEPQTEEENQNTEQQD